MLCPARCSCFLCRELQSCRAADTKKPNKMTDNFILKKSDAWDASSAMKFIRGAARMSVRHWQNREPPPPSKTRLATLKSTSCEQLFPYKNEDSSAFAMRRAPSTDRIKIESKPLFKILGNSRVKKSDASDSKHKRSVLNFRKNDVMNSKNVHEKYIPFPPPKPPTPTEHIYMEPRQWMPQLDECCRPPVYQSVERLNRDEPKDKRMYNHNRPPCYEELTQRLSQERMRRQNSPERVLANKITQNNNKVVIYFGDSIIRKHSNERKDEPYQYTPKEEVIYANQLLQETDNLGLDRDVDKGGGTHVSEIKVPEITYTDANSDDSAEVAAINNATYKKDGPENDEFLVVEFEENFETARRLVDLVQTEGVDAHEATVLDQDEQFDWSFIQGWRKRPSWCSGAPAQASWCGVRGARALRVSCAPAAARARRLSPPPAAHRATGPITTNDNAVSRELSPPAAPVQLRAVSAPRALTAQSAPVRVAPQYGGVAAQYGGVAAQYGGVGGEAGQYGEGQQFAGDATLSAAPAHINNDDKGGGRECNSSSDENRSSGHASMSDSGAEPQRKPAPNKHKHRNNKSQQSPWSGSGNLEQIRSAMQQLSARSDTNSTAASTPSVHSALLPPESRGATRAGAGAGAGGAALRRAPSLDTVCTNVTCADEFVWIDAHNRLVEVGWLPWSAAEVCEVSGSAAAAAAAALAPDTPPRLAYLLQRPLVRVAREAQRLSQQYNFCSKHEVGGAFRLVLATSLADACIKGCERAATMYATSGAASRRVGGATRARTTFSPGKFQRWMIDMKVAPFVHEYAAIYLCAGMETLLQELIQSVSGDIDASGDTTLITPAIVEARIAEAGEWWGLLHNQSHLNAGRVANGALSLPRWESHSSLGSGSGSGLGRPEARQLGLSHDSGITTNGSGGSAASAASAWSGRSALVSTCVWSAGQLRALLARLPAPARPALTHHALHALYLHMRCDQLEQPPGASLHAPPASAPPPLAAWLRVAGAAADNRAGVGARHAVIDLCDIQHAARLLLPYGDVRFSHIHHEDSIPPSTLSHPRGPEDLTAALISLSHNALLNGREDLLGPLRRLLPNAGIDVCDSRGLTVLMKAACSGDEKVVAMLLEAGADPNIETPGAAVQPSALLSPNKSSNSGHHVQFTPSTAGWTALCYASAHGAVGAARRLLRAGAGVHGAAAEDERCTATPLQLACGTGNLEMVQLLLAHGGDPFLSTQLNDALCYSAAAQYGCYSPIAICCAHGRRDILRAVWAAAGAGAGAGASGAGAGAGPRRPQHDVLSLEEVLAEGSRGSTATPTFTKAQQRALHDAMYCAAETDRLDITLELRGLGVAWSLHAWTLALPAAADHGHIDTLLRDFLQVCPSDDSHYSSQFIYECLPLLFNILRYTKKEGTILLLADIVCACYGSEPVPRVLPPAAPPPPRVDPAYVNSRALSDVTFRVEGRLFYGHKIVLMSESPRLRAMLSGAEAAGGGAGGGTGCAGAGAGGSGRTAGTPPHVQVNDVRYHIFEIVMKYVYSGDWSSLNISDVDVLEVLAAAAFFQLPALQRHCEARAASSVDLHNLVSVYIHAKVYNATELLEYCQGFLLQNMVALLTYDDSVKRLLFGKRLPGHNVLGALLVTLQKRIEARKNQAKSNGPAR